MNELKAIQNQYQSASEHVQVEALNESMERLREKAGLVEITDPGVVINLIPMKFDDEESEEQSDGYISDVIPPTEDY